MRIAVLVKQIPVAEHLRFTDGRIVRDGVELEANAYCRRANAKAIELAGADGDVVVFTLGPPSAEDVLREMIACGAGRGVHVCDPAFAGSDTLATARALTAAIVAEGPFDLVLCGLNSLDADTGQVGPEIAALLGWPFVAGARELHVEPASFEATIETDDGFAHVRGPMPAVISTAERLTEPSKAPPDQRQLVSAERITCIGPTDLGLSLDEVGAAGSPTWVGPTRITESTRQRLRATSVHEAVELLAARGSFEPHSAVLDRAQVPETSHGGPAVWCFLEPNGPDHAELLGESASLAAAIDGHVVAVTAAADAGWPASGELGSLGADRLLVIPHAPEPEQWAAALTDAVGSEQPWALLIGGTHSGRILASTVAARHGLGLTGDAIELEVSAERRLIAWKPAFGGRLVAHIESRSDVQMVTVRPGVLSARSPRADRTVAVTVLPAPSPARVVTVSAEHVDDGALDIQRASVVIGIGTGVDPSAYADLDALRELLGGAPLAATRRVTDKGWLPRSRQLGVTGKSISPHLYIAIGISGKLNHTIGIRNARTVLAVNSDPQAAVWDHADVGIVGDWREVIPALTAAIADRVAARAGLTSAVMRQVARLGYEQDHDDGAEHDHRGNGIHRGGASVVVVQPGGRRGSNDQAEIAGKPEASEVSPEGAPR